MPCALFDVWRGKEQPVVCTNNCCPSPDLAVYNYANILNTLYYTNIFEKI